MAIGMEEVTRRVAEYPKELQPFMSQFLIERFMITSHRTSEDFRHQSYQDLLLGDGVLRQADYFVPDEEVLITAQEQECYLNCFKAVCELDGYTYVEGLAQTNLLVIQHAWLEDPDGNLVDPTWSLYDLGDDAITPTYYGIRFDTEFVLEHAIRTDWCSMFAAEWEEKPDLPSLRFGLTFNEQGLATGYDLNHHHNKEIT